MAPTTLLTIDDFERLPADVAENHELVDLQAGTIYTRNRILTLQGQGQIETDLLPGLSIDLAELFHQL
jgi:hypothetical protein